MCRRLPYIFGCVLPLKTFVLYIYRSTGTMNKQATIQPIIFFLHLEVLAELCAKQSGDI
jgi:hypothetical protein